MNRDANTELRRLPGGDGGVRPVASYRMSTEAIKLIKDAAGETDAAQGDIIEECIFLALPAVREKLIAARKEADAKRAAALAQAQLTRRGPGRPRKQPVAPVLKKRQQN